MHAADGSGIDRQVFGRLADGTVVEKIRLRGRGGFEAGVITYGAALQSLVVPGRDGRLADVVLGSDAIDGYLQPRSFFGATIGRYANRIDGATFVLDGQRHRVSTNEGANMLHGGAAGFDCRCWSVSAIGLVPTPFVTLSLTSRHGDEGFPGELRIDVTYRLSAADELSIAFAAVTDRPTVVNLTNHSFFNLDGVLSNENILDHRLTLTAERFLAIDPGAIPLAGPPRPVAGTPFDFRQPAAIGARIRQNDDQLRNGRGYDHNFCLDNGGALQLAARLEAPRSGRVLELLTDQPGVQFYSGNYLDGSVAGKGGRLYRPSDALCLEPQIWPDAPNRPDFPSARLAAGTEYRRCIVYRFALGR